MLRCLCAKRLSRQVAETLDTSRTDISTYAPRIITIKIPVEKIRERIGSGGKTIRSIVERTDVKIDVEDDGRDFKCSPPYTCRATRTDRATQTGSRADWK